MPDQPTNEEVIGALTRDIWYSEDGEDLDEAERTKQTVEVDVSVEPFTESIEFLYLRGTDGQWNWGRAGRTNAAFLHKNALEYFRRFFRAVFVVRGHPIQFPEGLGDLVCAPWSR